MNRGSLTKLVKVLKYKKAWKCNMETLIYNHNIRCSECRYDNMCKLLGRVK